MINLVASNKVKVGDEFYSPIYGRKIGVVAINDKGHIYFSVNPFCMLPYFIGSIYIRKFIK